MILKNGKRLDGMGDSMPIGSVIEYKGTDIPDGWEKVEEEATEEVAKDSSIVLTINNKEYDLGCWNEIDITPAFEEFCKENSGFIFENGQIKVSPDANFTHIEILYYSKLLLAWTSDTGNRGVYIYHNGVRQYTDFDSCPTTGSNWYSDTYRWVFEIEPGDYFTIALVRGGQVSTIKATIEHGYIKANSL